ncbi:MAG: flagellar hook-basal body protein [Butyrivibrio sp.]|nr:flagellar hook-basal body protein [Butyrivibrio sp.]
MVKGLYTAYTGMVAEQQRMDIETNNLANVNSAGYKEQRAVLQPFRDYLGLKIKDYTDAPWTAKRLGGLNPGVKMIGSYTNFEQGAMQSTGGDFDLALNNTLENTTSDQVKDNMFGGGNAFFAILVGQPAGTPDPEQLEGGQLIKYTRDGSFTLTGDGYLVTSEGNNVLDVNGQPIQVNPDLHTTILPDGRVVQDGQELQMIQVARFSDPHLLEPYETNAFIIPQDGPELLSTTAAEAMASVNQGYLESSNVSVVDEMVNIITIQRDYETNQKMIQTEDDTLQIAVQQLGKLTG